MKNLEEFNFKLDKDGNVLNSGTIKPVQKFDKAYCKVKKLIRNF